MKIDINTPVCTDEERKELERKYNIKIEIENYYASNIIGAKKQLKAFLMDYEMCNEKEIYELYKI
jgi:hypothetical protein